MSSAFPSWFHKLPYYHKFRRLTRVLEFIIVLEWFSFECRKVIGFTQLRNTICLDTRASFKPIRSKTILYRDSLALVFPRFTSATRNHFEFWLVHWIVCVRCDWLEYYLGFGLTKLKWNRSKDQWVSLDLDETACVRECKIVFIMVILKTV